MLLETKQNKKNQQHQKQVSTCANILLAVGDPSKNTFNLHRDIDPPAVAEFQGELDSRESIRGKKEEEKKVTLKIPQNQKSTKLWQVGGNTSAFK